MRARLIHATLDIWLLGGIPLLAIMLGLLIPASLHNDLRPYIPYALILFSYPHFMASYYAFYRQKSVWTRHWFAALLVPLSLIGILSVLMKSEQPEPMQWLTQITLVLLFWHYLKQSYGSCIWLGHMRNDGLRSFPRNLLLGACLMIGCLGFFMVQGGSGQGLVFGMYMKFLPVPPEIQTLMRGLALLGVLFCCLYALRLDVKARSLRASLALLPLIALWVWFEPYFQSPLTLAFLPVLHGLQYLPFVGRVLWNDLHERPKRAYLFWGLCAFLMGGGYALFYMLPRQVTMMEIEGLAGASLIFLNIHHYFIDASIWRLSQPEVRERLLRGQAAQLGGVVQEENAGHYRTDRAG
jgi:hypothetical protein